MPRRVTVKTGPGMSEGYEPVELQVKTFPRLNLTLKAHAQIPGTFLLCTYCGPIFQNDVLIHVTQMMSFVCK